MTLGTVRIRSTRRRPPVGCRSTSPTYDPGVPSIFTRIIDGELPGHFVWRDDECVAFLSIAPLRPGHTLVVPRLEVDHWLDLPPELAAHLMTVAQRIGRAQQAALNPTRVGLIIAGMEVPHTHLHVIPIDRESRPQLRQRPAGRAADELAATADAAAAAGAQRLTKRFRPSDPLRPARSHAPRCAAAAGTAGRGRARRTRPRRRRGRRRRR